MGEVKKHWGQFTDNDILEPEGRLHKFLGVQKRYGDQKEEVSAGRRVVREARDQAQQDNGIQKSTSDRKPEGEILCGIK